jgi:hypothetical protein
VDILKHSVEYIRTLQRILSEYDDFTSGGGEVDPTPSPSTTCSSPSLLYPGETESGYGSPPLPLSNPVDAISPPVRHSPGNKMNSRLSPIINQSPSSLPYQPSHNSEGNALLQTRLSPVGDNSAVSRRHSFGGDGGDGNFNLTRLSPTSHCSLQQRLSPRISDPLVFSPQQQQQQQQQHQLRFSPAIQPHMKGGCGGAASDGSLFPGVRPIGKQYTWQVSDALLYNLHL